MKLTAAGVQKIKPTDKRQEIPDSLCVGLYLVVQPSGKRGWQVRYRHGGKHRRMSLGPFPALGLVDASSEQERSSLRSLKAAILQKNSEAPKRQNPRMSVKRSRPSLRNMRTATFPKFAPAGTGRGSSSSTWCLGGATGTSEIQGARRHQSARGDCGQRPSDSRKPRQGLHLEVHELVRRTQHTRTFPRVRREASRERTVTR